MAGITIEYWQQSNPFTITLRGHQKNIPFPSTGTLQSDFDPVAFQKESNNLSSLITQMTGTANYNTLYESLFAPADFKISGITMRLPAGLPVGSEYKVSFRVNGGEITLLPIPELKDFNQVVYGPACDMHIWEDDFIEIAVDFGSETSWNNLIWNDNNMVVGISGCFWYEEYKDIFPGGTKTWNLGDNYFKTNITIQNRSGNDILADRVYADIVKAPGSFLMQGIRLSMFEDELMTNDKLPRKNSCFFADILVNGKSVNETLGVDRPVSLDSLNNTLKSYNSTVYNNAAGYPILFADDILIKIYAKNLSATYNSKIMQVILFGCSSDCVTLISDAVTVYELCGTEPCAPKFTVEQNCNPNSLNTAPNKDNPTVSATTTKV